MTPEQIDSALLALHNLARAFGGIASALGIIAVAVVLSRGGSYTIYLRDLRDKKDRP